MRWQWSTLEALSTLELYEVLALRQQVFVVEQTCAYLDADGADVDAHHLLGWQGDHLVAYARVLGPSEDRACIAIGRVVTSPRIRGTGQGRPLMRRAMEQAWATFGKGRIHISAQAHLEGYYSSLGFAVSGEGYDEDGIPHLPMDWGMEG